MLAGFVTLLICLIIVGIFYFFISLLKGSSDNYIYNFLNGNTYTDYCKKYPDCLRNGKVKCHQCGSGNIFLQHDRYAGSLNLNRHICRQCGAILYHSGHGEEIEAALKRVKESMNLGEL